MRQDDDERFIFICNTDRNSAVETTIHLNGIWVVRVLDTLTGEESYLCPNTEDGWTTFPYKFEGCASLLLRLSPSTKIVPWIQKLSLLDALDSPRGDTSSGAHLELDSVSLSEPNVLMLDYAEYKLNDEDWNPLSEVLKIDNLIRSRLQLPLKGSAWKQPWAISPSERTAKAVVTLRFSFFTSFTTSEPTQLALEPMEGIRIYLNDTVITRERDLAARRWWVDEAIEIVPIPENTVKRGKNILQIVFPFGILTNIERMYLLGAFSIQLGVNSPPMLHPFTPGNLTWGDITSQHLPFYAGNIIYNCTIHVPVTQPNSSAILSVPHFSSPVLTISNKTTGKKLGRIAFQPRTLNLGILDAGLHEIEITAFGNRYNAFGHIHMPDGLDYCSPDFWRCTFFFQSEDDWNILTDLRDSFGTMVD